MGFVVAFLFVLLSLSRYRYLSTQLLMGNIVGNTTVPYYNIFFPMKQYVSPRARFFAQGIGRRLVVRVSLVFFIVTISIVFCVLHTFPHSVFFAFIALKRKPPVIFVRRIPNDGSGNAFGIHPLEGLSPPLLGGLGDRPMEPEEPIERRGSDMIGGTC